MKITDLADGQSVETIQRFSNMIHRIKSTEMRIRDRISAMESRHRIPTMRPKAVIAEPADLPELAFIERAIGKTDDILSIEFLEEGLIAKRPVGRILNHMGSFATGFLVGEGLVMTAAHALPTRAEAAMYEFQMGYEENRYGTPQTVHQYTLDPDRFYFRDDAYDVCVIAAVDYTGMQRPLEQYGWFVLSASDERIEPPEPVSIIQHPKGGMKKIVVHNSRFIQCDEASDDQRYCWYTGDTHRGSSGAPVFDPRWDVVALHHRAVPKTDKFGNILGKDGQPVDLSGRHVESLDDLIQIDEVAFVANQGVRKSRIFKLLESTQMETTAQQDILSKLLECWTRPGARARARTAAIQGANAFA